ncbi:MAG: hypothetical protein Q8936_15930 [Bacillota bacterium]|nr:hypothetical protein [Bacillota bacterium]
MEFQLNKISLEVRQRINDRTSEGKVHRKGKINIRKYTENDDSSSNDEGALPKKRNTNKIIIKAEKSRKIEVNAFLDEEKNNLEMGRFLDIKK